jgi:hypothetical protein
MPVYHRLESESQTPETAAAQQASGEIWGGAARNVLASDIPKVKAYGGPLPDGARGVEFVTEVPPDPGQVPGKPTWTGPRRGVRLEDGFAKIAVTVTKNTQTRSGTS